MSCEEHTTMNFKQTKGKPVTIPQESEVNLGFALLTMHLAIFDCLWPWLQMLWQFELLHPSQPANEKHKALLGSTRHKVGGLAYSRQRPFGIACMMSAVTWRSMKTTNESNIFEQMRTKVNGTIDLLRQNE